MLTSLALIFIVGLSLAAIFKMIKLPRIIGMLIAGIVLGAYALDLLSPSILGISAELRQMALVIIIIKAGLSLDISDLKKVGRPAVLLSFLPAVFEIIAFVILAPVILKITYAEAAVMGAVMSAVSPAVVVPRMVSLIEEGRGTNKQIPQMILAGASLDDVFVIVLFTAFLGISGSGDVGAMTFFNIPISIALGVIVGIACGILLTLFFGLCKKLGADIRASFKVLIVISIGFLLLALEDILEGHIAVSGLLAIMSMSMVIKARSDEKDTDALKARYGKIWLAAEVLLFVLVGAEVNIKYALGAGAGALVLILIALAVRSIGTFLCLLGTKLDPKERLYCIFAYLPKATVQAAIGGVPLAMGLACGEMVLSVAVLGILVTAPLGAILMDISADRCLSKREE